MDRLENLHARFKDKDISVLDQHLITSQLASRIASLPYKSHLDLQIEGVRLKARQLVSVGGTVKPKIRLACYLLLDLAQLSFQQSEIGTSESRSKLRKTIKRIYKSLEDSIRELPQALASKTFFSLVERRFLFPEREKYKIAFGTRFSRQKERYDRINDFFVDLGVSLKKDFHPKDRLIKISSKLSSTQTTDIVKADLLRQRAKGRGYFLEYLTKGLGVDISLKAFRFKAEKEAYVLKLLHSKMHIAKGKNKKVLKVAIEVLKAVDQENTGAKGGDLVDVNGFAVGKRVN